jgi:hypothetical protein
MRSLPSEPARASRIASRREAAEDDDVTASEVAAYAYCAKAWHLENVVKRPPDSDAGERREVGVAHHEAQGARVRRLQRVGRPLLLAALFLFAIGVALAITALVFGQR